MKKIKELETLGSVHRAIKLKLQGTASQIAEKIGISRSCLYKYISEIESFGGCVKYSRISQCFYYINDFEFKIIIQTSEMNQIIGGKNFYSVHNL